VSGYARINRDFVWRFGALVVPLQSFWKKGYFLTKKLSNNMFAIVSIAGQQFKVEEGQQIFVHRLAAQEGDALSFDAVHLIEHDGNVNIGAPYVGGASVSASVLSHVQGDKIVVFHKKRRKGHRKKIGHRQQFTKIQIDAIKG
jgi:large subunit ribosomal protein L21